MVEWYVDKGLGTLIAQVKKQHPGISIGTIRTRPGPPSEHYPEEDGSVDAADFMVDPLVFTEQECDKLVATLVRHKDRRIAYIIWKRRIISSTVQPWVWRSYKGPNPHDDHAHLSVNDKHENDKTPWDLSERTYKMNLSLNGYSLPTLQFGDNDDVMAGPHYVTRVQMLLNYTVGAGLRVDGVYGSATAAAVKALPSNSNGRTVGLAEWIMLYGLSRA